VSIINDSIQALAWLLAGAAVTYPLVAATLRQNAHDRHKGGNR